jgi:hypothetical protein
MGHPLAIEKRPCLRETKPIGQNHCLRSPGGSVIRNEVGRYKSLTGIVRNFPKGK